MGAYGRAMAGRDQTQPSTSDSGPKTPSSRIVLCEKLTQILRIDALVLSGLVL